MKRSEMVNRLAYYISGEYSGEGDRETTQDHINEADFLLSKLENWGMVPPPFDNKNDEPLPYDYKWEPENE